MLRLRRQIGAWVGRLARSMRRPAAGALRWTFLAARGRTRLEFAGFANKLQTQTRSRS